jgi:hypothetical protein
MSSPRQKKLEELHCKKVDASIKKLQEMAYYIEKLMKDLESGAIPFSCTNLS